MPFVEMPGVIGLVFEPDPVDSKKKKHNCADCFACGMCSDERCDLCLRKKGVKCKRGTKCGKGGRVCK